MRFIIPLLFALVATTAILVVINVSLVVPLSADTRYVTWNGTHYSWTSSKGTTNFMISSFVYVSGDASLSQYTKASAYGGSCDTYFWPTVVNWANMPVGQFFSGSIPAGTVYYYKWDSNTLLFYCTRKTSLGTTYYDLIPYKVVATVGQVTWFRLADTTEVNTGWCTSPNPGSYSVANIYASTQWYSCVTRSWGSWGGNWGSLTPTAGQTVGGTVTHDFTTNYGFKIILGGAFKVSSGTNFIGKPFGS